MAICVMAMVSATPDICLECKAIFLRSDLKLSSAQPFHHCRVTMVEETTHPRIQRKDGIHIFGAELKIEDVKVFNHSFLANRLWDHHYASLRQPAQDHLSNTFLVFPGDGEQQFILEDVVLPFCERSPGFNLNIVFL